MRVHFEIRVHNGLLQVVDQHSQQLKWLVLESSTLWSALCRLWPPWWALILLLQVLSP